MARIKGGQRLQWMSRNTRPLPGRASIIPEPNSMGLRPGESYITDDSVPLGEREDVFRAGYLDPRASVTPPQTQPAGSWGANARGIVDAAKGTPEQQEKERKINEINAEIDRIVGEAGYGQKKEEESPETAYQGPEKEYLEQPTKDGAFPNATPAKEAAPQSKLDVLKEMNKAIKEFTKGDNGPPQDKVGSSGMPDWAESGTGIVGRGATPPAAQTPPPPPMDQVGKEWREEWATTPPPPPPAVAAPAPDAPAPDAPTPDAPVVEGQQYMLSQQEVGNIGSMTFDNLPTDRLILPVSFPTRQAAADEFDRLADAGKPYPPVIKIVDEGEYINIKDDPELGRFTYSPEDIQLYNGRLLIQLQNRQATDQLQRVNQQLGQ